MRIIDTWRERRRNIETYRQLSGMSDQMLADIGITRQDLAGLRRGHGLPGR
jgi:Domain of unknown function (DUF1127).